MLCIFIYIANAQQKLLDVILNISADGDTLTVAPGSGTLADAINNDLNPPPGRVYLLQAGYKYYNIPTNITIPSNRPIRIVGSDPTPLVQNHNASNHPPIICGDGYNTGGINFCGDLTIKNCAIIQASPNGTLGWCFFWSTQPNSRLTLDNCLLERTRWTMIAASNVDSTKIYIRNCYFVNMNGNGGRRSGGVYDNVDYNTDTIWVENSTHIYGQGMLYRFRNFPIHKVIFNHNTCINIGHSIFETDGYQSNMSVTQNIFINCQTKPYRPNLDIEETDVDSLPTGIINVRDLPVGYEQLDRKILVDRNLVYWDPRLANIADTANSIPINRYTNWVSQMIKMNTRTKSMFDDNTKYPYLTEGTWYNKLPNFERTENLLGAMVDTLKHYSVAIMDTNTGAMLPDWRLVFTGPDNYVVSDWPIPIALDYDDAGLTKAAMGNLPLGDLNWFPAAKATYDANRDVEYAEIEAALQEGRLLNGSTGVRNTIAVRPMQFRVDQNYPNPFNPSTTITYQLPTNAFVNLRVYDVLGREVETLVNERQNAGDHSVTFNAGNLPSGVYFYRLQAGNYSATKKLLLLK